MMRTLACRVLALSALASILGAQSSKTARGASIVGDPVALTSASALPSDSTAPRARRNEDAVAKVAPTITVSGEPKSFRVVAVPVPAALSPLVPVSYTIIEHSESAVLSRRSGVLAPERGTPRALLVTVGIPTRARAGNAPLARVRFAAGAELVDVPIELAVLARRNIQITAGSDLRAGRGGVALALPYRIANLGNASDTVTVRLLVPPGWRIADIGGSALLPLPTHGSIERVARLAPPIDQTGAQVVRIVALVHDIVVASLDVTVELTGAAGANANDGALLTLGTAVAAGPWSGGASGYSARIEGQLTDDIGVLANVTSIPTRPDGSLLALSQSGFYAAPPSVALWSPSWRVGLGLTGTSFSDLGGVSIAGEGASLSVTRNGWNATALAARPSAGYAATDGELAGARVERTEGGLSLSSSVSHLVESRFETRRLDAVTFGAGLQDVVGGRWLGEIAERRYEDGDGFGWSTTYSRRTPSDVLDVRYAHAPGGSRAFARATNDLSLAASHRLGNTVSLNAGAWRSDDDAGTSLSGLQTRGWSFGTQLTANRYLVFGVDGRRSDFEARTALGAFGTGETMGSLRATSRIGALSMTAEGFASSATRRTMLEDGDMLNERAPRTGVHGMLSADGERGALEVDVRTTASGEGVGFAGRQTEYGAKIDRVPLFAMGATKVTANASTQRMSWFGGESAMLTVNAGLSFALPYATTISITAERNPFLFVDAGQRRGQWMYVMSVSRAHRLARVGRKEATGTIYRDLNGNGVRDAGEPGFEGVVMRRGFATTLTDHEGRYAFRGITNEPIELDARSLPIGWLPRSTTIGDDAGEIGVIAMAAVDVRLALNAADSTRVGAENLEKIGVIARDSTGRAWVARRTNGTQGIFDALPPGRYTIELDASDIAEPLRIDGGVPSFVVDASRRVAPVTLQLRTRAVRMKQPLRLERRDEDAPLPNPSPKHDVKQETHS